MPEIEVDLIELPQAVVVAWGVTALRVTGSDGVEYATVVLDLQFQVEAGKVAQQSFLFHQDDARSLRVELKNPQPPTQQGDQQ